MPKKIDIDGYLLASLVAAAESGAPTPSLGAMARGMKISYRTISRTFSKLVSSGKITSEYRGKLIRVTIVSSGKRTDWTKCVSGILSDKITQPAIPHDINQDHITKRKCLKCHAMFQSHSPGNRICGMCKELNRSDEIRGHPDHWMTY